MKTLMKRRTTSLIKTSFLMATVLSVSTAFAYDDEILNSDPINIDGYVSEAPVTDRELETVRSELKKQKQAIVINKEKKKKYKELGRTTEKLADETEEMIEERKESQETIDRYNKRIDCLMNDNKGAKCAEFVKYKARPKNHVEAPHASIETKTKLKKSGETFGDVIKVLPYSGVTAIQGSSENLEANITLGMRVESDITSRFSIGLGFSYLSLQTTDFYNSARGFYQTSFFNDYANVYPNGREVEYANMSFEMYSKYFITKTRRFRPYVGGGLSYNRAQANFLDNRDQQVQYNTGFNSSRTYQFGDEEIISSHVKVNLVGGSEIIFTKNFGINLELQYSRGLGGNLGSDAGRGGINTPDQDRLQALNDELNEANIFGLYIGGLIMF